jgi:hypothetical protein
MDLSTRTPDEDELYAELSKHTHPIQAFTMMQGSTAPLINASGDDSGPTTIRTMLVDSYETVKIASGDGEIVSKIAKKKKNGFLKSLFAGNSQGNSSSSSSSSKKESPAPSSPPPPPMLVYAVEEKKKRKRDMMSYNTREKNGSTLTSMVASFPLYTAFHMMKTMPGKLMLLATAMNNGNGDGKKKPSSSISSRTTISSPMPMQGFANLKDLQVYTIQDATINYHITTSSTNADTTIAMMPLFLSFRQANSIVQKHIRHMIRARLVTRRIQRMIQCARTEAMAAIVIGGVGGGKGAPPSFPSRGSNGFGSDDEEAMEEPPEVTEMIQEMMTSVEDQFFTGAGGGDEMGGGGGGGGGYPPPSSSFSRAGTTALGGGPVGRALATLVCGSISLAARTLLVVGNVVDSIAANTPVLQQQFLLGNTTNTTGDGGRDNTSTSTTIKKEAILPQVVQVSLSDVLQDIETHNQSQADMLVQQGRVEDREEYNKRIASAAVWMGLRMKLTVQSLMVTRGLVKAISEATASLMQSGTSSRNGDINSSGLAFPLPVLQNIQNLVLEKNNYFGDDDPDLHYWLSLLSSDDDSSKSSK